MCLQIKKFKSTFTFHLELLIPEICGTKVAILSLKKYDHNIVLLFQCTNFVSFKLKGVKTRHTNLSLYMTSLNTYIYVLFFLIENTTWETSCAFKRYKSGLSISIKELLYKTYKW